MFSTSSITPKPLSGYIYVLFLFCINIINTFKFNAVKKTQSLILCFHSIANDNWQFTTKISDFKSQIKFLVKTKKIVPLDEMIKNSNIQNQISFTFDDGYKDFLTNALPILNKYKIKGTLFVLGTPEKANRKALDNNKKLLTTNEIKQIKKLGWEIGFHTNTHSSLTSLSTDELYKEIIEGKQSLENKLGFKLRYFAYPMGEYSQKVIEVVKKAGFEAAFSTNGGAVSTKNVQNMHIIDRLCLEGYLSQTQFETLLSSSGLWFNKQFIKLIRLKAQLTKYI